MVLSPRTNEWEFQGALLGWINADITEHNLSFDMATQEFPNAQGRRSDIVIWSDHTARSARLELELKTPRIPLRDDALRRDAVRKAQTLGAPYLALWNMRTVELYRTPPTPTRTLTDDDLAEVIGTAERLFRTEDWLNPDVEVELKQLAHRLVIAVHDLILTGAIGGTVIDATVFVDALKGPVSRLRTALKTDFARTMASRRAVSTRLRQWAQRQGLAAFVSDLSAALAGQLAYRLTGQVLFYYSFRRHQPSLPTLSLSAGQPVGPQLRTYWDRVRSYDYEALFGESPLEDVELSVAAENEIRRLVDNLSHYDWDSVREDVLGSIFEQLLPETERILLGQYYTPAALADVVLSMTLRDHDRAILDPAVGSGTFLLRAYDRLRRKYRLDHADVLDSLWGIDISAFATELAVINLCRQDLSIQTNFPRVTVRDFFTVSPSDNIELPVSRATLGSMELVSSPLPAFDAVVGNPPFVRSQQLDDLDTQYKLRLSRLARDAGVYVDAKFDAFAYFLLHAYKFLHPGGSLGFVTSAAWLTSQYGAFLQRYLLEKFRIKVVLFSESEPFFPHQDINTVVVIAERPELDAPPASGEIRFVTLTRTLADILPAPSTAQYWTDLDGVVDAWLQSPEGVYRGFRVSLCDAASELVALINSPRTPRNWAAPLRESPIYRDVILGDGS